MPDLLKQRSSRSTALLWISLAYYAVIGVLLHFTRGSYDPLALCALFAGWVAVSAIGMSTGASGSANGSAPPERVLETCLWGVIVFFGYKLLRNDMVHVIDSKHAQHVMKAFLWGSFVLSCAGLVSSGSRKSSKRFHLALCIVTGTCLFAAQIFAIRTSLHPTIDVFTVYTAGAEYLRHGLDPYAQAYADIYHGAFKYVPVYAYWPGTTLPESICKWIFGDIRWAFIFANAAMVLALGTLVRALRGSARLAFTVPLLWLSFPAVLFVLDQAWVDTMLVLYGTLFTLFAFQRRWIAAGIALGAFCATKQYSVFFGFLSLLLILPEGKKPFVQLVVSSLLSFSALILPFALWNWGAFFRSTITGILIQPARKDALSLVAMAWHLLGWSVPGALSAAIYLIALALASVPLLVRLRRAPASQRFSAWSTGLVLVYGATFLFGKQAFCNYYYFLAFLVLLQFLFSMPRPEDSDLKHRAEISPSARSRHAHSLQSITKS